MLKKELKDIYRKFWIGWILFPSIDFTNRLFYCGLRKKPSRFLDWLYTTPRIGRKETQSIIMIIIIIKGKLKPWKWSHSRLRGNLWTRTTAIRWLSSTLTGPGSRSRFIFFYRVSIRFYQFLRFSSWYNCVPSSFFSSNFLIFLGFLTSTVILSYFLGS